MQAVKRENTRPEMLLRKALWQRGARYRLGRRVAGTRPDLLFPGPRVAVFVDGCFWHGCPEHYVPPTANADFWRKRIGRVATRDARDTLRLQAAGYDVVRVWECAVESDPPAVAAAVAARVHDRGPGP
jgi:DNA mismatch endonuclease (patch repair protein)